MLLNSLIYNGAHYCLVYAGALIHACTVFMCLCADLKFNMLLFVHANFLMIFCLVDINICTLRVIKIVYASFTETETMYIIKTMQIL